MRSLLDIAKQTWCGTLHGVMVKIDDMTVTKPLWMRAYCVQYEALHTII